MTEELDRSTTTEGMSTERTPWIVVGIDFSEGSMRALEYALEHASKMGASVACVHAYEDSPETPVSHDPALEMRKQLEEVVTRYRPDAINVRVHPIVRRGAPWRKLANVATDLGAELIAVGAEGQRGACGEGFLGTVAYRLVTTSPRAVVVVPSGRHLRR